MTACVLAALAGAAALASALIASPAFAEDVGGADLTAPPEQADSLPVDLHGALARIEKSGEVRLGYRDAAFPFSFSPTSSAEPQGYSIDLCKGVVAEIGRELHSAPLRILYARVSAEDRFDAVASGRIDIECGSTTDNLERRSVAAFSPVIFITGTKLLARRDGGLAGLRDLNGHKIVVTSGTTNEKAVHALNDKFKLGLNIVAAPDHEAAFAKLVSGETDAFATDEVLLQGLVAQHNAAASLRVVGDFLTYEPYGLMFAKEDPDMAGAVARAFTAMAVDGDWKAIYAKWFLSPTPGGAALDLPMAPQLTEAIRAMGGEGF